MIKDTSRAKFNKIKILIVEDDKAICEMYAVAFMREGFTVYTAPDGERALEKYQNKEPDILLLDIMMPKLDGYGVLREVRKDVKKKYIPIVMLTNLDPSHFENNASFDCVDEYLIKANYTPSEVVEKVKGVLKLNKLIE